MNKTIYETKETKPRRNKKNPTSDMNKLRKDEGFLDRIEKKDFSFFFFFFLAIEYGSGKFSISYGEEYIYVHKSQDNLETGWRV